MIDLTQVILAAFALISTVVTAVVVPYIREKTTVQQREQLLNWTRIAVTAAEQVFTTAGLGKQKKEYVLAFLSDRGFDVDEIEIDAIIESAVYQLKYGIITVEEM